MQLRLRLAKIGAAAAVAAVAAVSAACGTTATSTAPAPSTTAKASAPGNRAPRAPTPSRPASSQTGHGATSAASVIYETVGAYSFRIRVLSSIEGPPSAIASFATRVEALAQPAGGPGPLLNLQGTGQFAAVELQLTNTGHTSEPSDGEGVAALSNGLPLMVAANPNIVGVTAPGSTGLQCPSNLTPPSVTNFGPDSNNGLCVELFNAVDGPMISPASSNPETLSAGQSATYVDAFSIPPNYSLADLHLAINTDTTGDEGTWAQSVPISGPPQTIHVVLPAGFTAGLA